MAPNLRKSTVQISRDRKAGLNTCVTRTAPTVPRSGGKSSFTWSWYLSLSLYSEFLCPSLHRGLKSSGPIQVSAWQSGHAPSRRRPENDRLGDDLKSLWGSGYRIQFHSMSRPDRTFLCAMVASSHLLATRSLGIFIAKDDAITWEELLQPLLQKVTTTLE